MQPLASKQRLRVADPKQPLLIGFPALLCPQLALSLRFVTAGPATAPLPTASCCSCPSYGACRMHLHHTAQRLLLLNAAGTTNEYLLLLLLHCHWPPAPEPN